MNKLFIFLAFMAFSCSVFTKKDFENEVQEFLAEFERNLDQSDSVILFQFNSSQREGTILAAIRVFQNKENEWVKCQLEYNKATIRWEDNGIHVDIPVILYNDISREQQAISFWLIKRSGMFKIEKMFAEDFYQSFSKMVFETATRKDQERLLKEYQAYFVKAQELQQTYDSVIWFTRYNQQPYFYVVRGEWKSDAEDFIEKGNHQMGLTDGNGKEIIPVEYNLIGTPGMVFPGTFEVTKNNKVGYYSTEGKLLLNAEFEWVVPYNVNGVLALAQKDSAKGWMDTDFVFHEGLPSAQAEEFMSSFQFLSHTIKLGKNAQPFCQVPNMREVNSGVIVPPAYLVKHQVFAPIMYGFTTDFDNEYGEGTEYIEARKSGSFDLSGSVKLLVMNFKNRFLGGREEFYYENKLTIMDGNTLVSSAEIYGQSVELSIKNDSLLEAKVEYDEYWEPDEMGFFNFPGYEYFQIRDGKIAKLESNRQHAFTQYVKLDSTYLSGEFKWYNELSGQEETLAFVTTPFLEMLRFEILADNGYTFTDSKSLERLEYCKWYSPSWKTFEEVYEVATETDRHNLDFIQRMIGPFEKPI